MADVEQAPRGLFSLPNEILLNVLSLFATKDLVHVAPSCRQFHSLVVRILHHRIQIAASLDGHTLYLECGLPATQWQQSKIVYAPIGTDGLGELGQRVQDQDDGVGTIRRLAGLYTRFSPTNKEPDFLTMPRLLFGDIPGSRTYMSADAWAAKLAADGDVVARTIAIDADMPFSQLQTYAYLGKRESTRGMICSIQSVWEGTIRVWRDWASSQCQTKRWSDGELVPVTHEDGQTCSGKGKSASVYETLSPRQNSSILWTNSEGDACGVQMKVTEQSWPRENPLLWASGSDQPVSYKVELEEVLVKTTHLLLMLEEVRKKIPFAFSLI